MEDFFDSRNFPLEKLTKSAADLADDFWLLAGQKSAFD